MKNDKLRKD